MTVALDRETFASLRETPASELQAGDLYFLPGLGMVYGVKDGAPTPMMGWAAMEGRVIHVLEVSGNQLTGRTDAGVEKTDTIPEGRTVLMFPRPTCDRCGREASDWPIKRGDVCSPRSWVRCIRQPKDAGVSA